MKKWILVTLLLAGVIALGLVALYRPSALLPAGALPFLPLAGYISSPYARRFLKRTSDPAAGVEGDVYWKSDTNALRVHNGSAWETVGGATVSPGGSDTFVQFNDGGSFGGDAGLVFDKTGNILTVSARVNAPTFGTAAGDMAIAIGGVTPFGISSSQIYPQSANKDLGAAGGFEFRFVYTNTLSLKPVAFASLPASPTEGMMAWVNDSNTAVYGATAAGGGANKVLVAYDGTNWKVH